MITARCGCGAVRFTSEAGPVAQVVCHCTDCQEATGAACARIAFFKQKASRVTGDVTVRGFTAGSGKRTARESCTRCGTLMFDRSDGFPALVGVMAERLDAPFRFEPACHVWTRSKRPDVVISDGLPQHAENLS